MAQYTYKLSRENVEKAETKAVYRLEELQGMTTYQLKEICQRQRLVVPMGARLEREELIRFIMRYRGIREYRQIRDFAQGGMEALQEFIGKVELKPDASSKIAFPAHLVLYEGEGIELTDHYDPTRKVLNLSDSVYGSQSVAAIGVAAHECGHALQHRDGYLPLKIRSALVPAANIGSRLGLPIVILGLVLGFGFELPGGGYFSLAQIGVWVFALAVLFQIVTLPVEFDASGRALAMLGDYGMMNQEEVKSCKKVLSAAALTYVAAAASSILQLLRLVLLTGNRRSND